MIGADGRHSMVAEAVGAGRYHEKPQLLGAYYSYWSGLPMDGRFETCVRPHRGVAAWPTNDDLTVVIVGWPFAEFGGFRSAVEASYLGTIDLVPSFAERVRGARRETRFAGTAVANVFRTPYGLGWALVGDAGYNRDFITGFGIGDAFLDAESCAGELDEALSGRRPFDVAMAEHQTARDERVLPFYELTTQIATLEPLPAELELVLRALPGNQEAMDAFVRVTAASESPAGSSASPTWVGSSPTPGPRRAEVLQRADGGRSPRRILGAPGPHLLSPGTPVLVANIAAGPGGTPDLPVDLLDVDNCTKRRESGHPHSAFVGSSENCRSGLKGNPGL